MNKFILKALTVCMSLIMTTSVCTSAYAASEGSIVNDFGATDSTQIVGKDEAQGVQTEYSYDIAPDATESAEVYLTIDDGPILVTIPNKVILSGTRDENNQYTGYYKVKVDGDFSGDKTIFVVPDETVKLSQKGITKVHTATVTQDKTEFTALDVQEFTNTSDGKITAENLTAGSWNGTFSFNISTEIKTEYVYYSTLALAVADANALTTENADILPADRETAVAALAVDEENSSTEILLINDSINTPALTISQGTMLDLDGNTITFAKSKYLTYQNDFEIKDGTIVASDAVRVIDCDSANTNSNLVVSNLDITETFTSSTNASVSAINSYSATNNISNTSVDLTGSPKSGAIMAYVTRNLSSVSNFKDIKANVVIGGNTTSKPKGMQLQGNSAYIEGANIYAENTTSDGNLSVGIYATENLNNFELKATDESPILINGAGYAVQTNPTGKCVINGGKYISGNHTVYILGNADISNAEIQVSNDYTYANDLAWGFYCGGPRNGKVSNNNVVNITNCKINNGEFKSEYGICTTWNVGNYGYIGPAEINITDCEIYEGERSLIHYNYVYSSNVTSVTTKFNLYGDTKLYDYDGNEISKETLTDAIDVWKNIVKWPIADGTSLNGYTCGNKIISGTGKYDEATDTITCWNAEDANVYDYRP